jgi:hypothetical protein
VRKTLDLMYKEPKKYVNEFQLMAQDVLDEAINGSLGIHHVS